MIFTGDTIFSLSLIDQNPCGFDTPSTRESVPIPPPNFTTNSRVIPAPTSLLRDHIMRRFFRPHYFDPKRDWNEPVKRLTFRRSNYMPCNIIQRQIPKIKNSKNEPVYRISLIYIQLKPVKRVRMCPPPKLPLLQVPVFLKLTEKARLRLWSVVIQAYCHRPDRFMKHSLAS